MWVMIIKFVRMIMKNLDTIEAITCGIQIRRLNPSPPIYHYCQVGRSLQLVAKHSLPTLVLRMMNGRVQHLVLRKTI